MKTPDSIRWSGRRLLATLLCAALLISTVAEGGLNAVAATHTLRFENPTLAQKYAATGTTDNTVNSATAVKLGTESGNTYMEFSYLSTPVYLPGFRVKDEASGNNITFDNSGSPYYKVELKHMAKAIAADATVELRLYWGSCRWSDLYVSDEGKRDHVTLATYTAADISSSWQDLNTLVQFVNGGVSPYYGNGIHFAVYVKSGTKAGNIVRVDDIELTAVSPSQLVTVSLQPGVGSLSQTSIVGLAGDTVTLPVPTAPVEFTGWQNAAGDPLTDADPNKEGFQYTLGATTTLTATYTLADCVLTLDPNGGVLGDSRTMVTGKPNEAITWPADPTKEGYTFTGWVFADNTPVGNTFPQLTQRVYASWDPAKTPAVSDNVQTFEQATLNDLLQQKFSAVSDFTNHTDGGDKALKTTIKLGMNSQRKRPRLVLTTGSAADADLYKVEAGARYAITMYVKPTADTATVTAYVAAITDPTRNITAEVNPGGNDCHRLQDNVMWSVNGGDFTAVKEIQNVALTANVWNRIVAIVPSVVLHDASKENYLSIGLTDFRAHDGNNSYVPYDVYFDDIAVQKLDGSYTGDKVMDLEILANRVGEKLDIREANGHTATVFYGENHTENGSASILINDTAVDTGNERAQVILTDGNGQKLSVEAGKQYEFSFWFKLRQGSAWKGNEDGIRFWLVPSQNGVKITDSSLDGVKNRYRLYETEEGKSIKGSTDEWQQIKVSFTAENVAGDVSGDLVLGISTYFSVGSFWIDDILLEDVTRTFDPNATVQDFEMYNVGSPTFALHQKAVVSDRFDHTTGTGHSLEITNSNWSGSDRNQIRLLDPANGQPLKLEVGKEYLLSFWAYLPAEAQEVICLNVWLSTTDDSSKRIESKGDVNCEIDDGGVSEGTELAVGEWTRVTRYFIPQNDQEVIIGLCDSYRQFSSVKYYVDDISLTDPVLCTVTLDGNGMREPFEPIKHVVNTKLDKLPEPVRPGYKFMGWCWDKDGQYPFLSSLVSEDITLYAAWLSDEGYVYEEETKPDKDNERPDKNEPEYDIIEKWERVPKDPSEITQPVFDVGERPQMEAADAVVPQPNGGDANSEAQGLPSWAIILIIVAAVAVVGGGSLAAWLLMKRKSTDGEKEVA